MKRLLLLFIAALIVSAFSFNFALAHPSLDSYTGAETCAECHGFRFDTEEVAREFTQSVHFAFKTEMTPGYVFDAEGNVIEGNHGKADRYCGLPGSIPGINWLGVLQANNPNTNGGIGSGCGTCHTGNGSLPISQLGSDDAWRTVDCMICHSSTYRLNGAEVTDLAARRPIPDQNNPSGFRMPLPTGEDLTVTSQSISDEVTTAACQRCHLGAGGGYINKRGHDFVQDDVHAGSMNCTDCHVTDHHQIAMGRQKPGIWANEMLGDELNQQVSCEFCHSEGGSGPVPEHDGLPANHLQRIDCQTCHIPTVKGLEEKWFNRLRQITNGEGLFLQWTFVGRRIADNSPISPRYYWFDGTVLDNIHPRGDRNSENAKIHPFRKTVSNIPFDDETNIALPFKLGMIFGADSALSAVQGDTMALINNAIRTGVAQAAAVMPEKFGVLLDDSSRYSGSYHWGTEEMVFSIDHGMKPAEEALNCVACHDVDNGRMNWVELGYDENPYPLSVKTSDDITPESFGFAPVYPNPFNSTSELKFTVSELSSVGLTIYDAGGRQINRYDFGQLKSGIYTAQFDGIGLPAGIYIARLSSGARNDITKLALLK